MAAVLRIGICAPLNCKETEVATDVVPQHVLLAFSRRRQSSHRTIVGKSVSTRVVELSHWDSVRLDFAIVGFDNCGTTSLRKNLQQITDIAFRDDAEDTFF